MGWRFLMLCATTVWLAIGPAQAEDLHFLTEDFRPYSYGEDGRSAGPVPEIIRAACTELGRSCTIEQQPWRRVLQAAQAGETSGTFVAVLPERQVDFRITTPIVQSAFVLFADETSPFSYRQPSDLGDRRIGVYGPSGTSIVGQEVLAEAHIDTPLVLETANDVVLRMLSLGRYGPNGVGLVNRDVGLEIIRSEQIPGLKIVGALRPILYGIGLSRKSVDETEFARFNDALSRMKQAGRVKAILTRYGLEPAV
jgi:polar amino acid transport system substrate-binding protein